MSIMKIQGESEKQNGIYYEIDSSAKEIGIGGMGKVYEGQLIDEKKGLTRAVAIKFLYDDLSSHIVERARREASIRIKNDSLVEMISFFETENTNQLGETVRHYHVVSELLNGVCLYELLQGKTVNSSGESIPYAEKLLGMYMNNPLAFTIEVMRSCLSGVAALHDAGYIHRDIDPSNIMITSDGHIKLIDFGIAKKLNALISADKGLTSAGVFIGKPWYAAPELVLGDLMSQNRTTDIYALGILLYQLYMKKRPFEGSRSEVLNMQRNSKIQLRDIPDKRLRKIIAKSTAKVQNKRYQTANEMRVDIDKLLEPEKSIWTQVIFGIELIATAVAGMVSAIMFYD